MAMDMYPPEKDFKYYLPNLGMSLFYQVLMNTYWLFCSCCSRCVDCYFSWTCPIISVKAIQAKCSIIQMAVSQLQDIWVISKALCNILFWHVSILVLLVSFGSRHLYQKRTKNTFSYIGVLVCMGKKSLYSCPQIGLWAFPFIYLVLISKVEDLFNFGVWSKGEIFSYMYNN